MAHIASNYNIKELLNLYNILEVAGVVPDRAAGHDDRQFAALLQGVGQGQEGEEDVGAPGRVLTQLRKLKGVPLKSNLEKSKCLLGLRNPQILINPVMCVSFVCNI